VVIDKLRKHEKYVICGKCVQEYLEEGVLLFDKAGRIVIVTGEYFLAVFCFPVPLERIVFVDMEVIPLIMETKYRVEELEKACS
jgi:hypothetical protein